MSTDPLDWLPLALSLLSVPIWIGVLGGVVSYWHRNKVIPTAVLACILLAAMGSVMARLVWAPIYIDPGWDLTIVGHVQRALLVLTGLYALVVLLRSRGEW